MAEIEPIDNKEEGYQTLSSQFQKPEFQKVINVLGKMFNHVQGTTFEIKDGFWIDDAVKNQLTILANTWNVLRGGKDDDELRPDVIKATTASNSGTTPQVKSNLLTKFGATVALNYGLWDAGEPAAYAIITDAIVTQAELEKLSAGGVGVHRAGYLIQEGAAGKSIVTESGKNLLIFK